MKSMTSLFIVNALIIIFLILSLWYKISLIPLFILLPVNILLIYIKSTALDKNEQKKKIHYQLLWVTQKLIQMN